MASVMRPEITARDEARTVMRGTVVCTEDGVCNGEPVACGAMMSVSLCCALSLSSLVGPGRSTPIDWDGMGLLELLQATLHGAMVGVRDISMLDVCAGYASN